MAANKSGYSAALKFILDREHFGIKLGLDNIGRFLNRIDNPQNSYPSIHIAGTNGKGSTAVFIESILRQAGYKTGIFTSPHLADFRERIRVNGNQISKRYITRFIKKHKYLIARNKITFFEVCTALAFCFFADQKVDIAIVETGLGGRLDATNTLLPILSIITDISYDHTNILGETLTAIAGEKAGIIKPQTPVLIGLMKPEPKNKIKSVAKQKNAPFLMLQPGNFARNGYPFRYDYYGEVFEIKSLKTSLLGAHQIKNSALAIRAVELIKENGFNINKRNIKNGLAEAIWRARFEILKQNGRPDLILDVGHNPAGVKAMVETFRELYPNQKADIVIGFVRNKNLKKSIQYLKPITRRVEVVRMKTDRTAEPAEIASFFGSKKDVVLSDSVEHSVDKLLKSSDRKNKILICGSHFLVGEFINAFKNRL
jgi:dihydrofolate synthase / folylpolyglutamate synthase